MNTEEIPVRGKWKKTTIRHMTGEIDAYRCSLCGGTCQWKHKICPICKGLMDVDEKRIPDSQPRLHGKWIWDGNKYICSECGHFPWRITTEEYDEAFEDLSRENAYKFCPNCGAKMESGVQDANSD